MPIGRASAKISPMTGSSVVATYPRSSLASRGGWSWDRPETDTHQWSGETGDTNAPRVPGGVGKVSQKSGTPTDPAGRSNSMLEYHCSTVWVSTGGLRRPVDSSHLGALEPWPIASTTTVAAISSLVRSVRTSTPAVTPDSDTDSPSARVSS